MHKFKNNKACHRCHLSQVIMKLRAYFKLFYNQKEHLQQELQNVNEAEKS